MTEAAIALVCAMARVLIAALAGAVVAGLILTLRRGFDDEALEEMLEQVNGQLYLTGFAEGASMARRHRREVQDDAETEGPTRQEPGRGPTPAV